MAIQWSTGKRFLAVAVFIEGLKYGNTFHAGHSVFARSNTFLATTQRSNGRNEYIFSRGGAGRGGAANTFHYVSISSGVPTARQVTKEARYRRIEIRGYQRIVPTGRDTSVRNTSSASVNSFFQIPNKKFQIPIVIGRFERGVIHVDRLYHLSKLYYLGREETKVDFRSNAANWSASRRDALSVAPDFSPG